MQKVLTRSRAAFCVTRQTITNWRRPLKETDPGILPRLGSLSDLVHELVVRLKAEWPEWGSPWENGYNESFNGKLRDEWLNGEIFYTLQEAKVLIEDWRWEYNHMRPHSSLNYRPPAPEAWLPSQAASAPLRQLEMAAVPGEFMS